MLRNIAALICAVGISFAQAQISVNPQMLLPSPMGGVFMIGKWVWDSQTKQEVYYIQVIGQGADPEQARNNGFRLAVEQAVGTLILSEAVTANQRIVRNEIITYASGFVNRFKVLDERKDAGQVHVTMDVWVGRSQMAQRLMNESVTSGAVDGDRLAVQADTLKHQRIQGDKVLAAVLADFPHRAFDVELDRSQATLNDRRNLQMSIPVTISWNKAYVRALYEAALAVGREPERCVFSRECAQSQAGLYYFWVKGRGTIIGWNGWVAFDDHAHMQAIVTRATQHSPALQIIIYDSSGFKRFESCQPFLLTNLEQPASGHRPPRYMLTIQERMITLDERYGLEGTRWINFGSHSPEGMERINAKVIDKADCTK